MTTKSAWGTARPHVMVTDLELACTACTESQNKYHMSLNLSAHARACPLTIVWQCVCVSMLFHADAMLYCDRRVLQHVCARVYVCLQLACFVCSLCLSCLCCIVLLATCLVQHRCIVLSLLVLLALAFRLIQYSILVACYDPCVACCDCLML